MQEVEALTVVFPQARFLTPSAVSDDPVDPPFMKVFENLKIYNLCDRAFPFVTFAHRSQRPSSRPSRRPTSTDEHLQHTVPVLFHLIHVNSDALMLSTLFTGRECTGTRSVCNTIRTRREDCTQRARGGAGWSRQTVS